MPDCNSHLGENNAMSAKTFVQIVAFFIAIPWPSQDTNLPSRVVQNHAQWL